MGKPVLAGSPASDQATLFSGSSALPVANLQTFQPGQIWRPASFADAWVELDFGAATLINLIALLYTNISSAGTWQVRAATTQGDLTANPDFDSGVVGFWPQAGLETWRFVHGFRWLGAAGQTFRWWRIDLFDAANPAGFLKAGRLYLVNAWQPTRSLSFGWTLGREDISTVERSVGGAEWPNVKAPRRVLGFKLGFLSQTEMMSRASELERVVGASRDVLVIKNPDDTVNVHHTTVYGRMAELQAISEPNFNLFEKSFVIKELLP